MHTSPDSQKTSSTEPVIEEICLEGRALSSANVGVTLGDEFEGKKGYSTVGQLIAGRHQILCNCYGAEDYSDGWRQTIEAELEAQERVWRKFVMQRAIPKADWALFRELKDHILRQLTYTERFGSFRSHVESVMPNSDEQGSASRRELAVRLQSVKLLDKRSIPTSVRVAVKLLAMNNSNLIAVNSGHRATTLQGDAAANQKEALQSPAAVSLGSDDIKVLAEQLERNWKKRVSLVSSITEYGEQMEQSAINWSNVESMLNVVGRQWKAIGPVARHRDEADLEEQFNHSFNAVKAQLEVEYDQNAEGARQLLGLSSKLKAQPASSASLESALILHRRIDEIGLLRRADQEDILARIRRNISAVVEARKQQLKSMHAWRALRSQALDIIKLLDRSGKLFGDELLTSYVELEPQLSQFSSLLTQLEEHYEPIHRGASPQALNAVFLHKQAVYMRKLDKESEELRLESLEAYNEACRLIGNVEQAMLDSDLPLAEEALAMAVDYMNYVRSWPANGEQILMARLESLKPGAAQ